MPFGEKESCVPSLAYCIVLYVSLPQTEKMHTCWHKHRQMGRCHQAPNMHSQGALRSCCSWGRGVTTTGDCTVHPFVVTSLQRADTL